MKVLIVDDIQDNRVLLRGMLESRDFSVDEAANGAQALALAQDSPPDLIVSDILMPEMDGFVLCRVVKGIEKLRRIPFVFYTATYLDKEDEALGMAIGAARYIHKPVEPVEFLRCIDEVLTEQKKGGLSVSGLSVDNGVKFETLHQERLARKLDKKVRDVNHLEKQLKMFKVFAETTTQGMGWADVNGNIEYVNPALAELFGENDRHKPLENNVASTYYPAEEQQRLREDIFPSVVKNGAWSGELMLRQTSGNLIATYNNIFLIHDETSKAAFFANIVTDITEQKRMADEILKIKKLESVGVLAGGIAHDFNNILAAILGNIELAAMSIDVDNEAYSLLQEAKKASLRAKDLTQQLLTFSKGGEPVKKTGPIGKTITDSANFVLHGSAVLCRFSIPDDLYLVDIDAGQISQVIQNLVINAKHAMPEGGEIRINCSNIADISSETSFGLPEKAYIKIITRDDGCGIAEKYLEKIFDPYFTTKQEGSGLGLATSHSIINKHKGEITVQSTVGEGTTFTIYLPASNKQPTHSLSTNIQEHEIRKANILVMDDDLIIQDIAKRMLERLGHEALQAKDGNEAIEIFNDQGKKQKPVDIIIMDLTIPGGMGGKEAIGEILKIDPDAKVIVSSGYSNDPIMAHCKEYGFKAAIAKPFLISDLKQVINDVLE